MSPSSTAKAAEKELKCNKEDKFSPFWGYLGGKKNELVTNLKFSGWMNCPNSQMESCLVWKKRTV